MILFYFRCSSSVSWSFCSSCFTKAFPLSLNQTDSIPNYVATLRQMALARMLVIVSTIFIVTASPIVALSIARSMVYDFFVKRRYTKTNLLCHTIYLELGMLNSSGINFVVYVMRSSRFRQELARFVCFRFLKRKKAEVKKEGETIVNTKTTGAS